MTAVVDTTYEYEYESVNGAVVLLLCKAVDELTRDDWSSSLLWPTLYDVDLGKKRVSSCRDLTLFAYQEKKQTKRGARSN